ncbi:Theileria-specific conserved protein, putative [Theileria annulata]|uniref:Theileria-specific conserved protein, putative n=1 Tax=Theileria annulata TaxID=5874 RepID=Q4UBD7_THEAN|nr:Theileria-specific conserved protein, putative [Theileria annulata]CAI75864.1 Theileria-specific conserved protein, putative [Theileria annulata]|eukprot:XP_955340.1 Theileria-specific conserved protein, putative [Theileria annulata]
MNVLLIVSLYFTLGSCIVLRLPLSIEDSKNFSISRLCVHDYEQEDNESHPYVITTYEANNKLFHEVYYHGVLIFSANFSDLDENQHSYVNYGYSNDPNDENTADGGDNEYVSQLLGTYENYQANQNDTKNNLKDEDNKNKIKDEDNKNKIKDGSHDEHTKELISTGKIRRLLSIMELKREIMLFVYTLTWDVDQYSQRIEKILIISDDVINSVINQNLHITTEFDNVPRCVKIIKNILTRDPAKRKSYDDLDQVDDVPYLIKGNDISPEKTKKEVEQIINNPTNGSGISEQDLKEAGPSGTSTSRLYHPDDYSDSD